MARLASGGRHGMAQSVFQVGGNFGTALGPLLAAFIVLPYGQGTIAWFSVVALLGMVLLTGVGTWYGKTLKLKRAAPAEEREAIAALGRRKVAISIAPPGDAHLLQALLLGVDHELLHLLFDPHLRSAGADGAALSVPVPRRRGGRHGDRRPDRRPHRHAARDLVVDPRRAALHPGAALCGAARDGHPQRHHRRRSSPPPIRPSSSMRKACCRAGSAWWPACFSGSPSALPASARPFSGGSPTPPASPSSIMCALSCRRSACSRPFCQRPPSQSRREREKNSRARDARSPAS